MTKRDVYEIIIVLLCVSAAIASLLVCRYLYSDGPLWVRGSGLVLTTVFILSLIGIFMIFVVLCSAGFEDRLNHSGWSRR